MFDKKNFSRWMSAFQKIADKSTSYVGIKGPYKGLSYEWDQLVDMYDLISLPTSEHVESFLQEQAPSTKLTDQDISFVPDLKSPTGGHRNVSILLDSINMAIEDLAYVANHADLVTDEIEPDINIGQSVPWTWKKPISLYSLDETGAHKVPEHLTKRPSYEQPTGIYFHMSDSESDIGDWGIQSRDPNGVDIEHSEENGSYLKLLPWGSLPEFLWAVQDLLRWLAIQWKEGKPFDLEPLITVIKNICNFSQIQPTPSGQTEIKLPDLDSSGAQKALNSRHEAQEAEIKRLRANLKALRSNFYRNGRKSFYSNHESRKK